MNLNLTAKENNTYDAIVVGSGISGGWAAKELCEKGLKVLLLERGRDIKHIEDYENATKNRWELSHRNKITNEIKAKFPVQTAEGNYPINEANQAFWLAEDVSPYINKKPFDWYRGGGVGGKSLLWGRMVFRWGDFDFEANAREGIAIDWPIRYKDIEPWYAYVEKFIGVSGAYENIPHMPDSVFQPPMEMNCVEKDFKEKVKQKYGRNRIVTIGRVAHITQATDEQTALGRASCQYRDACSSGCPYGAYFSTQAATLPAAQKTGNLTLRPHSVVSKVLYNEEKQKAEGVEVIDAITKEVVEYYAKVIFLNASTAATTHIMLNSKSKRFPNGLGNDSGQLGKNLMDHHSRAGASASVEGYEDQYYYGRRANGIFMPRFRNIGNDKRDYLRGFDFQGGASRGGWNRSLPGDIIGNELKEMAAVPGGWNMNLGSFGECLPYEDNQMYLHESEKDQFGIPKIVFDAEIKENELKMRIDMANDAAELLEAAGYKNVKSYKKDDFHLGLSKHEMGTARMGKDPKTSVLNAQNQVWGCENVFVTDGACMTSSNCVNPSLTYMALTARACDFAVGELKKLNL
jgi:choline dehydrogenase-like flavoprotein